MKRFPQRTRQSDGYFKTVPAGQFELSLQGSRTHYSAPQGELAKLSDYATVEAAIFRVGGGWVVPAREGWEFDWVAMFEAPPEPFYTSVAGYVPQHTVRQIIRDLEGLEEK